MRRLSLISFVLALLTGCTNSFSSPSSVADKEATLGFATDVQCNATSVQSYVGQRWHDSLDVTLRRASTSHSLRLLKPGQVMTLELNPYRLNVVIDAQGAMTSLYCA